ncbi:solute carrier family 35 (UDP-galactose transporter), member B1 [Angomonas deanei]|uniref:UAA transporter family, putative n=1 Tax=Angomonas deanei TaxID=59799 RepID=A0A7G2CJI2_9TRYP|nr:solute carrier family 35 (UDP-galactose transporter), member B1 [Angomonas deanei]CAD2218422.1 UAA transporter family, putative [Angomonas deanei]|eukprot:EPY22101.1 solute carrier family 35 (UDP-galactose transporter), member B1 [Angomonas deanei]
MFTATFSVALLQCLAGILIGGALLFLFAGNKRSSGKSLIPTKYTSKDIQQLALMGFANIFGTCCGYGAMRRLSYPLFLSIKMSKMVPTIVVGTVVHHTRYPLEKILSCVCITVGVIAFFLLDKETMSKQSAGSSAGGSLFSLSTGTVGLLFAAVNLAMDGFTHSTQDELVRRNRWSGNQLMLLCNVSSLLWMAVTLGVLEVLTPRTANIILEPWTWLGLSPEVVNTFLVENVPFQELSKTVQFFATYAGAAKDVALLSVLNAMGQFFIFRVVFLFGSLTVTAMTIVRKIGSVILSIVTYGHVLAPAQWGALLLVFFGVFLEARYNMRRGATKAAAVTPATRSVLTPRTIARSLPPVHVPVAPKVKSPVKPPSPAKSRSPAKPKSPAKSRSPAKAKSPAKVPSPVKSRSPAKVVVKTPPATVVSKQPKSSPRQSRGSRMSRMLEELEENRRQFEGALKNSEGPLDIGENDLWPEEEPLQETMASAPRRSTSPRRSLSGKQ